MAGGVALSANDDDLACGENGPPSAEGRQNSWLYTDGAGGTDEASPPSDVLSGSRRERPRSPP